MNRPSRDFWRRWVFGDRKFYGSACALMLPIVIQALVDNFVSLLDDLMIGQTGTAPMSGVAIVNQLLQVYIGLPANRMPLACTSLPAFLGANACVCRSI